MSPLFTTFAGDSLTGYGSTRGAATSVYEVIKTELLASTTSSVTFGSIPAGYKHLQIRIAGRFTAAAFQNTVTLRFNSDATVNYSAHYLRGNGSSITSGQAYNANQITAGYLPSANEAGSMFGTMIIDLIDVDNTTKKKTMRSMSGRVGTSLWMDQYSGHWASTAAITTILVSDAIGSSSFAAGTRISLYGIRAA